MTKQNIIDTLNVVEYKNIKSFPIEDLMEIRSALENKVTIIQDVINTKIQQR